MDEPREPGGNATANGDDEAEVRRLLAAAGRRPEVPEEDLAAITAAARAAWRQAVSERSGQKPAIEARQARREPNPSARGEDGTARAPRRWTYFAAAAALLVALGLGAGWWTVRSGAPAVIARVETIRGTAWIETGGREEPLAEGGTVPAGAVVRTAADAGASLSLRLAGGAELRLDAGTRLHLPPFADPATAADSGSTRATNGAADGRLAVLLARGAVYADTGEDAASGSPSSSLRVRTPIASADDVGTRFAVRLLDGPRPAMRVRVRSGAVAVERGGERWLAPAGEELVVTAEGDPRRRPAAAFGAGWEWVAGAAGFDVDGRTVAQLLAWVTRETGWRLRWADPGAETAARSIVLHGDFGDLPPERAAFAVLPGADLEARLDGEVLVVSRR
jgi:hypothetical protein